MEPLTLTPIGSVMIYREDDGSRIVCADSGILAGHEGGARLHIDSTGQLSRTGPAESEYYGVMYDHDGRWMYASMRYIGYASDRRMLTFSSVDADGPNLLHPASSG